jgi:hypothetical protein
VAIARRTRAGKFPSRELLYQSKQVSSGSSRHRGGRSVEGLTFGLRGAPVVLTPIPSELFQLRPFGHSAPLSGSVCARSLVRISLAWSSLTARTRSIEKSRTSIQDADFGSSDVLARNRKLGVQSCKVLFDNATPRLVCQYWTPQQQTDFRTFSN